MFQQEDCQGFVSGFYLFSAILVFICNFNSELHFTDLFFPKSFKDTMALMLLMDKDDYFVREGTLNVNSKVLTFEVSAEQFDLYSHDSNHIIHYILA